MPSTFELRFTKVSGELYSGSLIVEGKQMAFGVPKTKEEIYRFLFSSETATPPSAHSVQIPAVSPTLPSVPAQGWQYVPATHEGRDS